MDFWQFCKSHCKYYTHKCFHFSNCNIFPSIISTIITLLLMVTITLFYNRFEYFVGKKQLQTIKRGLLLHWKSIWSFIFMKQFVNVRVFKISNITLCNRLVSYSWKSMCNAATTTISVTSANSLTSTKPMTTSSNQPTTTNRPVLWLSLPSLDNQIHIQMMIPSHRCHDKCDYSYKFVIRVIVNIIIIIIRRILKKERNINLNRSIKKEHRQHSHSIF